MRRALQVFVATLLVISSARAGPEFRVATGLLMLFDGGRKTPIRYHTQTDLNFEEGGSVRVFATVTPEGMADVEVLARSKVDFYFLGADVSLAPSGTIRATVEDIKHPQIKLTWDGGTASASKVLQMPEELLSYFIVSQPPVFSKSPIADDELSRIYPQNGHITGQSQSESSDLKDAVEVDFPFASPTPAKDPGANAAKSAASPSLRPKPSPRSRSTPSQKGADRALLAQAAQSAPGPSPALKSASSHPTQTPKTHPKPSPSPSPDLMPDLPTTTSDSPSATTAEVLGNSISTGPAHALQSAREEMEKEGIAWIPTPETTPILDALHAPDTDPRLAENIARQQMALLDWPGVEAPKAMPAMHPSIVNLVPEILPLILSAGPAQNPRSNPNQASSEQAADKPEEGPLRRANIQRPDFVLGGQKEFAQVLRALPAEREPGLRNDARLRAPKPLANVPDPVLLHGEPLGSQAPGPQPTQFVISSTRK
jgi:hypothetical protein